MSNTPVAAGTSSSKKNLLQQLPAGSVLAFQALAATFTNQGNCYTSNWWLTVGLVTFLSATCIFFSFTDSVMDSNGKVHKGVALPGRLHILNLTSKEQKAMSADLTKLGLKTIDWLHAILTAIVFLTIAGSDVGLQNCFFPHANDDTKQLLRNLPLGMAVMSSFFFMIFPTTRKGISFSNSESPPPSTCTDQNIDKTKDQGQGCYGPDNNATNGTAGKSANADKLQGATDKVLTSSANLLQLLPTGSVLAFQTLSSSFTNQGSCYPSNWWLTVGLVTFLGATCILFPFTDSIHCKGQVRKGVALPSRLYVFNMPRKDQEQETMLRQLREKRLKTVDWVHAFFTLVVFLTIAGSDVGLQNCFFPKANDDTRQLLKNLPLGMAVMSSFVFMILPTKRKGICFDNIEYSVIPAPPPPCAPSTSGNSKVQPQDEENPTTCSTGN